MYDSTPSPRKGRDGVMRLTGKKKTHIMCSANHGMPEGGSMEFWFFNSTLFRWYEQVWWWYHRNNSALKEVQGAIEEDQARDPEEMRLDHGLISRSVAKTLTQNRIAGIYGLQRLMLAHIDGRLERLFFRLYLRSFTERDVLEAAQSWTPLGIQLRATLDRRPRDLQDLNILRGFLTGAATWEQLVQSR